MPRLLIQTCSRRAESETKYLLRLLHQAKHAAGYAGGNSSAPPGADGATAKAMVAPVQAAAGDGANGKGGAGGHAGDGVGPETLVKPKTAWWRFWDWGCWMKRPRDPWEPDTLNMGRCAQLLGSLRAFPFRSPGRRCRWLLGLACIKAFCVRARGVRRRHLGWTLLALGMTIGGIALTAYGIDGVVKATSECVRVSALAGAWVLGSCSVRLPFLMLRQWWGQSHSQEVPLPVSRRSAELCG